MIIPFEIDKEKCKKDLLFYADKQRYSSMTSVVFINKNLLVCASYCMHEMYLVKFDLETETYNIIDTIPTIGGLNGKEGPTDLIDYRLYKNGKKELITSDFALCSVSVYELVENDTKLKYIKSVKNKFCGYCHGISYHPTLKDIIVFATTGTKNPNCGIYAVYKNKGKNAIPIFGLQEKGWLGKDVAFVNENMMIALYCDSAPNPKIKRQYSTKVITYQVDILKNQSRKLDEITIEKHHADSVIYRNGKIYVTIEGVDEEGRIIVYDVDDKTGNMKHYKNIQNNYYFPHGIDINYEMIAVTEYGRSDIIIEKFDSKYR